MNLIKTVMAELLALFVDDGSLVLSVVAWVAAGLICLRLDLLNSPIEPIVLAVGIAVLLGENVLRAVRVSRSHVQSRGSPIAIQNPGPPSR